MLGRALLLIALLISPAAPAAGQERPGPTLAFGGDVLYEAPLAYQIRHRARRVGLQQTYREIFRDLAPSLREADLAVVNLEVPISPRYRERDPVEDIPVFRAPEDFLDALSEAGVGALTIANNHAYDQGMRGLRNTLRAAERRNLTLVGAGENASDAAEARVITVRGARIAIAAWTEGSNHRPPGSGRARPRIAFLHDGTVRESVTRARGQADFVVAVFHWLREDITRPRPFMREAAWEAAEAGADLVIGHGTHVPGSTEVVVTSDGRHVHVLYSLGNLLAAMEEPGGVLTSREVGVRDAPLALISTRWRNHRLELTGVDVRHHWIARPVGVAPWMEGGALAVSRPVRIDAELERLGRSGCGRLRQLCEHRAAMYRRRVALVDNAMAILDAPPVLSRAERARDEAERTRVAADARRERRERLDLARRERERREAEARAERAHRQAAAQAEEATARAAAQAERRRLAVLARAERERRRVERREERARRREQDAAESARREAARAAVRERWRTAEEARRVERARREEERLAAARASRDRERAEESARQAERELQEAERGRRRAAARAERNRERALEQERRAERARAAESARLAARAQESARRAERERLDTERESARVRRRDAARAERERERALEQERRTERARVAEFARLAVRAQRRAAREDRTRLEAERQAIRARRRAAARAARRAEPARRPRAYHVIIEDSDPRLVPYLRGVVLPVEFGPGGIERGEPRAALDRVASLMREDHSLAAEIVAYPSEAEAAGSSRVGIVRAIRVQGLIARRGPSRSRFLTRGGAPGAGRRPGAHVVVRLRRR